MKDFYLPSEHSLKRLIVTPRAILLDPRGYFPMIPHNGKNGLPGGHTTVTEMLSARGLNLLDAHGSFPTLEREIEEEVQRNIQSYRNLCTCIGLTEIEILDIQRPRFQRTHMLSPIFLFSVPEYQYPDHILIADIHSPPKPLYPDAALAIFHLRRELRKHQHGRIFPEWLNKGRRVIFVKDGAQGFSKYLTQ